MKINFTKSILGLAAGVLIASSSFAQFTGTIEFNKTVGTVVNVNYKYYVSGDDIRVEEINSDKEIEGIQLMDLKEEKMISLSPERKMYMETPKKRAAATVNVEVENTKKTKVIEGVKCTEYIVTCTEKDRKVVYWIADGEYDFFIPMLKTLNRKENQSMFFLEIPNMEGKFPMMSTETVLSTGKVVSVLTTVNMKKGTVDAEKFELPAGYTKFER
ncbi:MAG: hypothetical protein ACI8Q1_000287 [Parvicella sp.]|jgi:hypothetical protein